MFDWDSFHLGDLPTWIAGVGTVAAFLATWLTLRVQQAQLKEVKEGQQERDREHREEQARMIAAWCVGVDELPGGAQSVVNTSDGGKPGYAVRVRYCNTSAQPVYDVVVFVKTDWGLTADTFWRRAGVLPPSEDAYVRAMVPLTVPPGSQFFSLPPVEIQFRDDSGRTWRRHDNGTLREVGKDGRDLPPLADYPAPDPPSTRPPFRAQICCDESAGAHDANFALRGSAPIGAELWGQVLNQRSGVSAEGLSKPDDAEQGHVPLTSLDRRHVCRV